MNRLSDPKTSRAVLIGAYEYQDQELENLPAVQRNLQRLRELLTDPLLWGLPEAHCRVLERPARETVLDTVMRAGTEATGHPAGLLRRSRAREPSLRRVASRPPSTYRDRLYTALRYADLRDTLRAGNICASRKVVILDCCWSGLALHGPMSADSLGQRATIDGTNVLTASAETRPSLAPPGETYTAFSGELINVLDRGIPDGPGLLAMSDLYGHIRQALIAKGRPEPRAALPQRIGSHLPCPQPGRGRPDVQSGADGLSGRRNVCASTVRTAGYCLRWRPGRRWPP